MTVKRRFPIGRRKTTIDERLMRKLEKIESKHVTWLLDDIVKDYLRKHNTNPLQTHV